ncbi:MAG TPA: DUF423 domain-containing protein [Polyangia bacterium]|jgi:uncharacterized membrane protein YgdD (TMEM256/DUF423 family)
MSAFAAGALTAALGVLLGAFGAHGLGDIGAARTAWWTTATHYLFISALGMMLWGLYDRTSGVLTGPCAALLVGALFFSGSLYAMGLGAPRWLGAITPIGGVALVVGFLWIALRAAKSH